MGDQHRKGQARLVRTEAGPGFWEGWLRLPAKLCHLGSEESAFGERTASTLPATGVWDA